MIHAQRPLANAPRLAVLALLAALLLGLLPACRTADKPQTAALNPDDFVDPVLAAQRPPAPNHSHATNPPPADHTNTGAANSTNQPQSTTSTDASTSNQSNTNTDPAASDDAGSEIVTPFYTVDALVGEVNGQSIYASDVLAPIHDRLIVMGSELSPPRFQEAATQLIEYQLVQYVLNALYVGEAEGELSDRQRQFLDQLVQKEREALLRKWGRGSIAAADARLRQETGKSLEQVLAERRQAILVINYRRAKIASRINVTRKDVEREYQRRFDEFNPPATRVLRLIRVTDADDADRVDQLLKTESFTDVASRPINNYKPDAAGLFSDSAQGDELFADAAVNLAVLALKEGEHTSRQRVGREYWWVMVEKINRPAPRPLDGALRIELRRELEQREEARLTEQFKRDLLERGNFTPMRTMRNAVLRVALSRYIKGAS